MKPLPRIATLIMVLGVGVHAPMAQQIIDLGDRNTSLQHRWRGALDRSTREAARDEFWIGFSFERWQCEHCYTGHIGSSEGQVDPSLNELIHGIRLQDTPSRSGDIRDVAKRTLESIDDNHSDRLILKSVAVLFRFKAGSETPVDVDMTNMSLPVDLDAKTLIWIGPTSNEESITLLESVFDSATGEDARRGALWAIASHDVPDRVVPFLSGVLASNASGEIRKRAAYGLGNQDTEESLRILEHAAIRDNSEEVSKAAVYALANTVEDGDVSALVDVLNRATNREVRKAVVYAIGNVDSEPALDALKNVLESDGSVEVRKAAIYALGNMDIDAARKILVEVIDNM